ncbi:MAG: thrombospondin type 3 repeat-containing protein [Flavobacteriales bacterium]|nr:thrombospondin type 3 repeat-containing protein [Flavobacteriales bacterium]
MERRIVSLFAAFLIVATSIAQSVSVTNSVQLYATAQAAPARITLNWTTHPSTTGFTIYRKLRSATTWGSTLATAAGTATSYQDNAVTVGTVYEYKVVRTASTGTGYGYVVAGIEAPITDYMGMIVLLVDNQLAPSLNLELQQLQTDLKADGWKVVRHDVSRTASVNSVRQLVIGTYNTDPTNVKAVYAIGHVLVPYSGNINPDGHAEHQGAWPCDGYYGEMNGTWTDNSVNNGGAQRVANRNIAGDGKFDQSDFPSPVELAVGRVDMYDMPAFSSSEVQLMKNYLDRAHSFKIKGFTPTVRGIVFDNLQWVANPLAGSAYKSMAPCVLPGVITDCYPYGPAYSTFINNQSYLWTYSSGGGLQATDNGVLTYNGADNITTTQGFAGGVANGGVFNMSFGSYFGDWDNRNNFLKAYIASGNGLSSVWAGAPNWWFHPMGLGEHIGTSVLQSMNNGAIYTPQNGGWQGNNFSRVHMGLMGDPTVRMVMTAPPNSLSVTNSGGNAAFSWGPAAGAAGYYLYKFDVAGVPQRIVPTMITGTTYNSPLVPFVAGGEYMVRAAKLEASSSGSYWNLSLGSIAIASGGPPPTDCLGVVGGPALPGTACNDGNAATGNDAWGANCICVGEPIDCLGAVGGSALPGAPCDDGQWDTGLDTYDVNCDCAGLLYDCTGNPGGSQVAGTPCNDGNANTVNDTYNPFCQCVGVPATDSDGDGVPNASDNCPNTPGQIGTTCNDGNACTINDVLNASCLCVGTPAADTDGDGVCNALDNCPTVVGQIGSACNDNNACTTNDVLISTCLCAGTAVPDSDGDGICNALDNCPNTPGVIGGACNDNNACTLNDAINASCNCVGTTSPDSDGDGICNATDNCPNTPGVIGSVCNDNNACTTNDVLNASCNCVGTTSPDSDGDGICNATDNCPNTPGVIGSVCNDNNACTTNDVLNASCNCVGTTSPDTDGDGICNATDNCPNTPGVIGSVCNDNNACTTNDVLNASCNCVGTTSPDTDGDGICNATDNCPNTPGVIGSACNDNNACTTNDVLNASCNCVGTTSPDTDGDGICNATDNCPNTPGVIGSVCNDNNACTTNDVLNASCNCVGTTSPDSDGDGICNATDNCPNTPGVIGSACNDGNTNTINDVVLANCTCRCSCQLRLRWRSQWCRDS